MRSVIPFVVLSGCIFVVDPPTTPTGACTEMAFASVSVSVVDEASAPLLGATVVYSVDGGAEAPCDDVGGGSFACGWERTGAFEIRASMADRIDATASVVVGETADGCHVDGQQVELSLVSLCDEPPAALLVTVLQPDGTAAVGESVLWGYQDAAMAPQPCEEDGTSGVWACAFGSFGALDLYVEPAEGDPYASVREPINVPEGDCGPATIAHTVTLQYLPD